MRNYYGLKDVLKNSHILSGGYWHVAKGDHIARAHHAHVERRLVTWLVEAREQPPGVVRPELGGCYDPKGEIMSFSVCDLENLTWDLPLESPLVYRWSCYRLQSFYELFLALQSEIDPFTLRANTLGSPTLRSKRVKLVNHDHNELLLYLAHYDSIDH